MNKTNTRMEATKLREYHWAIRPKGQLGTCGWVNGIHWNVEYVTAHTEEQALKQADLGREKIKDGDEYVLILMRTERKAHARIVTQRINDALRQDAKSEYTLHPMAVY